MVLARVLENARHGPWGCFHRHTPQLVQAVRLASVSKLWREAAVTATQTVFKTGTLCLSSRAHTQPRHLSCLLAELVRGCRACLEFPMPAQGSVPAFLDSFRVSTLDAHAPDTASESVSVTLSSCTSFAP